MNPGDDDIDHETRPEGRGTGYAAWRPWRWRRVLVSVVLLGWLPGIPLAKGVAEQLWPAVSPDVFDYLSTGWFFAGNIVCIEYLRFTTSFECPRCGNPFFGRLPLSFDWSGLRETLRRLFGWHHRCHSCRLPAGAVPS
jgi:hypothetical protein